MTDRAAEQEASALLGHWMGGINPCRCHRCQDVAAALQRRDDELARLRGRQVEECPNSWRDGTCPECGEVHYILVRREPYMFLKAQHEAAQQGTNIAIEERANAERRADYAEQQFAEAQREIERLREQIKRYPIAEGDYPDMRKRAEQAEAQVRALREALRCELKKRGVESVVALLQAVEEAERALTIPPAPRGEELE